MARKARVEFAGALYHVLDRGDRREVIFRDEADRARFLETLGEACGRTGWRVHAYVLISNHCHLMIETPQANLVAGMRWLLDGAGEKLRVRRAVDAPVRRSHGEDEARRLLRRGLAWLGLAAETLAGPEKGR